jgi:phage baseplate assembly protein gpV
MANDSQNSFELIRTKVKVEGYSKDIVFSNLTINQALADINSFSFIWRQEEGKPTLTGHVNFYKKYLSKEVTISIQDEFNFKGIIDSISCLRQDELGIDYEINGKGLFGRLDEVKECNTFYKKSIKQIFDTLNKGQGTKLKNSPVNTKELFYTVQYNQTTFEFYKMLAARYGEWLYYNGTEMVVGNPDQTEVKLKLDVDVHDIYINARTRKAGVQGIGYDHYKGEVLQEQSASSANGSSLISASLSGGESAFGSNHSPTYFSHAATNTVLKDMSKLYQQASAASSVYISGQTRNPELKLGGKIKIMSGNNSEGEYYITELHHNCLSNNNYQNQFIAVPAEVEVPPYTDPSIFPTTRAQPATVVDNEDKDGLDRIKVRFPWMQSAEATPWINVMTPYAGKDKGFRFLPEVGEEVQVDFVDDNAERPYMIGALFTEPNKSGTVHTGNHLKTIGSRSGRRFEIDDDEGWLKLVDNHMGKKPVNGITMRKAEGEQFLALASFKDDNNHYAITFNKENKESIEIAVTDGGDKVLEITMEKSSKKILIKSKGSIELQADKSISLAAPKININASEELKMEGKSKGASLAGMKVAITADTTMDVKGATTKVDGSAKLDLTSSALVSMAAALIKIN